MTKQRTTPFSLVKVTKAQIPLIASLIVFFNGQRLRAINKMKILKSSENYIHPISLQNIYYVFGLNAQKRNIVKVIANIFFQQVFRGSNTSKKCSGWVLRNKPHLNSQMKKMLPLLVEQNCDYLSEIKDQYYSIDKEAKKIKLVTTTTWTFKNIAQMEAFQAAFSEMVLEKSIPAA